MAHLATDIEGGSVAAIDHSQQVLDHIRLRGPSKAKEIAAALGLERTLVNNALYGPLRGKVTQGRNYKWALAAAREVPQAADRSAKNSRANLFAYYLDCLSQDDDSGVRTFADSKFELDYVELEEWPLEPARRYVAADPLRKLLGRQRRDARKKALWLGYPALVRQVRGRNGWAGTFLEPLLVWPQDPDARELGFLPEPLINTRALEGLTASENVLEEAAKLADELGLDDSEPPLLDELVARLRDLRPEWDWKEDLAPARLRGPGELRKITGKGIYNAAIVVLTDRSPFTLGLERELSALQTVDDAAIRGSSLGTLLGSSGARTAIEGPLLAPAPLNAEQRAAVHLALSEPLTVITGPPGTGKSQVVTAILVNAAWRAQRVLFASKNNKAVDVVLERVNALSPTPVVLRLGTQALQEQLAQHLTAILSARPTDDDRRAYQLALAMLKVKGEALHQLDLQTNHLIALRNRVDELEQAAQEARNVLPAACFSDASRLPVADTEARIADLRNALRRSDRAAAPFLGKLFWKFLKESRDRHLIASVEGLETALSRLERIALDWNREAIQERVNPLGKIKESVFSQAENALGLAREATSSPTLCLSHGLQFLEALKAVSAYKTALGMLSNSPDPGALAALVAKAAQSLAKISSEAWSSWTALLPDRLTGQDRAALGDYAAILRTILKADDAGGAIAKQLWRRYYQLAAKTTKALPCWAVTSLSARGRVPFTPGEFDLVVIDEASQCDIASALPLLFRAKRTVIIGDPQQLRHISRLPEQHDQALMVKHGILDNPGPAWGYRANSLYDLAAAKASSASIVVLRDHHRSHADIISFSNRFFYRGQLRVATDYRRLKRPEGPAIRWVNVAGNVTRPSAGGVVNHREADSVVEELRRIAITERFSGDIGVVTPFRAQANLIEALVAGDDALAPVLAARNFIAETAHKFQGDERDLIVFSPVVAHGISLGAIGFLKSQGNLFNVGITRARGALVVVGDAAACASSEVAYLSAFARYVAVCSTRAPQPRAAPASAEAGRDYPAVAHPERVSDWEKVLYTALVDAGFRPVPQFDVDQYALDLALIRPHGRRLDIEVDGEHYHRDWDGELLQRDRLRNLRLIEMGWDVLRLWVYEVRDTMPRCIARVAAWVEAADAAPGVFTQHPSPTREGGRKHDGTTGIAVPARVKTGG